MNDYRRNSELGKQILSNIDAANKARKEAMPTIEDALKQMMEAHTRLREFGFRDAVYCPKDGTIFDAIEPAICAI